MLKPTVALVATLLAAVTLTACDSSGLDSLPPDVQDAVLGSNALDSSAVRLITQDGTQLGQRLQLRDGSCGGVPGECDGSQWGLGGQGGPRGGAGGGNGVGGGLRLRDGSCADGS